MNQNNKIKIILLQLLFVSLLLYLQAQGYVGFPVIVSESSFRNLSTIGLLDDDSDIMFRNPADIPIIKGFNLYTNISNIITRNEFNKERNDHFTIGTKFPLLFDMHFAFIFREDNKYFYEDVGESDSILWNKNLDGAYYNKEVFSYRGNSQNGNDNYYTYFALGKKLSEKVRVGLDFNYTEYYVDGSAETWYAPADIGQFGGYKKLHKEETIIDITTNQPTFKETTELETSNILKGNTKTFTVYGVYSATNKLETGIALGMGMGTKSKSTDYYIFKYIDLNVRDTLADNRFRDFQYTASSVCNTGLWGARFHSKYIVNDKIIPDIFISASHYWSKLDDIGNSNSIEDEIKKKTLTTFLQTTTDNIKTKTKVNLDEESSSRMDIFARVPINIRNNITLAFGTRFSISKYKERNIRDNVCNEIIIFNDGDTTANDIDDSTQINNYTYKMELTNSTNYIMFSIPIAFELGLTDKLTLRFGIDYKIKEKSETTTDEKLISASDKIVTIIYGDSTKQTKEETLYIYPNDRFIMWWRNWQAVYKYSIGYKFNEYLSMDFIGFPESGDLKDWKLSAVLKLR